ncbi:hypothetical protein BGZ60DRAFT_413558 [Tricladium varicosporioides]|nr:hypothetical protein BGZ60DRAFT_413558 [Hymenoscyphus varicosporioides]
MQNTTSFVGWTSEPDKRGTTSLIYICLSTICICSWNAYHTDVPLQNITTCGNILRKLWNTIGACLLFPELGFSRAFAQRKAAKDFLESASADSELSYWSMTHAQFIVMGGFALRKHGMYKSVDATTFLELVQSGCVKVPDILKVDIEERSKANGLVKLLACLQSLSLTANIISRWIQHLTVTPLEILTLSLVFSGLTLYFLWWDKPMDVRLPIILEPHASLSQVAESTLISSWEHPINHSSLRKSMPGILSILVSVLLGCFPLLCWNYQFPSTIEQILWRIASVGLLTAPLVSMISYEFAFAYYLGRTWVMFDDWVLIPIYLVSRVYILIAVFLALRHVEASVYNIVSWAPYFPSFR